MSPEERKKTSCRVLHKIEEAERIVREAAQELGRLGHTVDFNGGVFSHVVVQMQNDAYMEYGKASFDEDHCGREPGNGAEMENEGAPPKEEYNEGNS